MVAKIESGKNIRGILHYNEEKVAAGEAILILASGFAGDIEEMNFNQKLTRFRHLTDLNTGVKTNALHISLNFDVSDKPDNQKLQQIAAEYMERIGSGDQPFLVYRHLDSAHPHIHIATTNIQKDAQRIDIHGIGYRLSEPARKEIEQNYELLPAEGRELKQGQPLSAAVYARKPTKQQISNIVTGVMRQYYYTSFEQYKTILRQYNILADRGAEDSRMFVRKGLQYSILNMDGLPVGVPLKASRIYCRPIMKNLEQNFETNRKKREPHKAELKELLDYIFGTTPNLSLTRFQREMDKYQVDVVYRTSAKGMLYGVTFIDHENKTVFNGSELGKIYSAKALRERFGPVTEQSFTQSQKASQIPNGRLENSEMASTRFLQPSQHSVFLESLLAQTNDQSGIKVPKRRKKRKRGRITEQQQQLTL